MKKNIMDCFDRDSFFSSYRYFVLLNNQPPNVTALEIKLDGEKFEKAMGIRYKILCSDTTKGVEYEYKENKIIAEKTLIFLTCKIKDDFMFYYKEDAVFLYYSEQIKKEEIDELIKIIKDCQIQIEIITEPVFYMVLEGTSGYELKEFKTKPTKLNIEENYNDDFQAINEKVIDFVNKENQSGIVLFHGKFGTGKTSYIRYLIAQTKKKVVYIPTRVFEKIDDPHFLKFLINNTGGVWVIEDCENLVKSRESGSYSGNISALLNLGDGLLSDALNIQVICTFNAALKNIDKALLRKGRLITRYEFGELSSNKTKALLLKNGIDYSEDKSLTLADIYNYIDDNNSGLTETKKLGF